MIGRLLLTLLLLSVGKGTLMPSRKRKYLMKKKDKKNRKLRKGQKKIKRRLKILKKWKKKKKLDKLFVY